MSKGGKREGAGRKAQGITKKVSLTLSEDIWTEIKQYENAASFIKILIKDRSISNACFQKNILQTSKIQFFIDKYNEALRKLKNSEETIKIYMERCERRENKYMELLNENEKLKRLQMQTSSVSMK